MNNNFTKRDIAMMSYGYSLRMADEFIESDESMQALTPEQFHKVRKNMAKDIVKIIGSEEEPNV